MSNFKKNFTKWKIEHNEHGPRAMTRFVLIQFVEGLHAVAPDRYIFKGGNLLWHYIKTPRSTVDVDFATDSVVEIEQVLKDFSSIESSGCLFKLMAYKIIESDEKAGLAVKMEFLTEEGSTNPFGIDVVFAVKTHSKRIKLSNSQIKAASLENIIIDKISTCYKFAGANTRMKDFDDLFRIAKSNQKIDTNLVKKLASEHQIKLWLDPKWVNIQTAASWAEYTQKKIYRDSEDLPKELWQLIESTNEYLYNVTNIAK